MPFECHSNWAKYGRSLNSHARIFLPFTLLVYFQAQLCGVFVSNEVFVPLNLVLYSTVYLARNTKETNCGNRL